MQLTPVQWLFEQINSDEYTHAFGKTYISSVFLDEALEMEKKQNEISDEEIEKFADEELGTIRTDFDFGVIQGMKWYREQLKLKK